MQTPRFAERGLPGESGWIELRLKLLADAGLVGLPNAGKSSLLRRLTRATPKVAHYPFTTVEPVLGTITYAHPPALHAGRSKAAPTDPGERQLVIADIPGLIEGAAAGAGLGHEFLAHVERCRVLVHLVSLEPEAAVEGAADLATAHETVRRELAAHGGGLDELPEIIALSKRDLVSDQRAAELVTEWRQLEGSAVAVVAVSAVTGVGLEELVRTLFAAVPADASQIAAGTVAGPAPPEFEAEYELYTPAGEGGFEVEREDEGAFRIHGRGIELLFARHDLENPEALAYLERRLREIGVVAALERAGFRPGDEVRIGEREFELDPG
jgi:GTP-binding protein